VAPRFGYAATPRRSIPERSFPGNSSAAPA
jgi:hypothetical protein